jgi:hypothetical protein
MNHAHRLILAAIAALLLAAPLSAQQGGRKASKLGKPVFPKLEYVNLGAELGLSSDMLRGAGARIDDARRAGDAAGVAGQAVLLAFAEDLAGRKGKTVTAQRVLEEAARIAEEQRSREGARAVTAAGARVPGSAQVVKKLNDALALLPPQRGEGAFTGYVRISNKCDRVLDVSIDGSYAGFVRAGETGVFSTGNGTTNARVTDAFGNTVAEMFSLQPEQTVEWTINP